MREWADHEQLAQRLNAAQCRWMLSSYDSPPIRQLFQGHWIVPVTSFSGMEVQKGSGERVRNEEVLILNYDPETVGRFATAPEPQEEQQGRLFERIAREERYDF